MSAGIFPVYCRYNTGAGTEHLLSHVTEGTYQMLAIALPHFFVGTKTPSSSGKSGKRGGSGRACTIVTIGRYCSL